MAAVHQHAYVGACLGERLRGRGDLRCGVVGARVPAAEHQVRVRVPASPDHAHMPVGIDTQEAVRSRCGDDGVDGDAEAAVSAVLETDRHRQPGGHFAVRLALRGARANGSPRHEIGDVLRDDRIEHLGRRGHAQLGQIQE